MKSGIEVCLMIQDLISEIHKNAKAVKRKKIIKPSRLFKFLVLSNKANQNPKGSGQGRWMPPTASGPT